MMVEGFLVVKRVKAAVAACLPKKCVMLASRTVGPGSLKSLDEPSLACSFVDFGANRDDVVFRATG